MEPIGPDVKGNSLRISQAGGTGTDGQTLLPVPPSETWRVTPSQLQHQQMQTLPPESKLSVSISVFIAYCFYYLLCSYYSQPHETIGYYINCFCAFLIASITHAMHFLHAQIGICSKAGILFFFFILYYYAQNRTTSRTINIQYILTCYDSPL